MLRTPVQSTSLGSPFFQVDPILTASVAFQWSQRQTMLSLYLGRGGARTSQHNLQTNQLWTTDALGNCYFLKGTDATCLLKNKIPGLPWWLTGQESTCQCRRHRFSPWSGKIPDAAEQLSQCATNTEPVLQSPGPAVLSPCVLEPVLRNKRSHQHEKSEHCN